MGKTVQVAADRAHDDTKTVVPAELARGIYIENPPGAQALKLMHLLISIAGGRMADDVQHELRMADMKAIEGCGTTTAPPCARCSSNCAGP